MSGSTKFREVDDNVLKWLYLENGYVKEPRKQWTVVVNGRIEDYENCTDDIYCGCLLTPELPKGHEKEHFWCRENCKVTIDYRDYLGCTRKEVLEYLIDFEKMHTIPKDVLKEKRGRLIREYEYP